MIRRRRIGFDDANGDAAARQIAGQHQAGRPGAGNQDFYIGQATLGRVARAYPHRAAAVTPISFDHIVGATEHGGWMTIPSALAIFRLTTSSYLVGACTGRVGRALALENLIDIAGGTPELIDEIGAVGDQATAGDVEAGVEHHGQPVPERQRI